MLTCILLPGLAAFAWLEPPVGPDYTAIVEIEAPPSSTPVQPPAPAPAPAPAPESEHVSPEPVTRASRLPDLQVWRKWPVWPTLLLSVDGRKFAREAEGMDGFAFAHARLGLRGAPLRWLGFVATMELASDEHTPALLDAAVLFRLVEGVVLDVGWAKAPLFASFYAEPVHAVPLPDRSPVVVAFRTRRDLGLGLLVARREVPLELRLRVGNGAGGLRGNDNPKLAGYGALDLVLGRPRTGHEQHELGLRLGVGGLVENAEDRGGIHATNPLGYIYARPTPIFGWRAVGEGHIVAYAGPARLTVEAALAHEARARDTDGNPDTPREQLPGIWATGATAELAVVALGQSRAVGLPPTAKPGPWRGGALELSGRFDWMSVNRSADDVAPGGSLGGALGLRWWPLELASLGLAGYLLHYDSAPIDQPGQHWSWGIVARLSVMWGLPVGRSAGAGRPVERLAD